MNKRLEYIDFAKGWAIFTIVCYHALQRATLPPLWQQVIALGGTGVHLFFLLSGFGLWLSPKSSPMGRLGAWQFYKRRLAKVWLPYVLALTISLFSALFLGLFLDGWDAWAAGVGLYQMFSERYIESFGGHFWFISAIIQFYIAYPALLWLKEKLNVCFNRNANGQGVATGDRVFLVISFCLSVAWWLLVYCLEKGHLRTWNSFFLQFLWEFALGMVIADCYKTMNGLRIPNFASRTLHLILRLHQSWWFYPMMALFFMSLMAGLTLRFGAVGKIFNDVPALLGYAAFSIFLYRIGDEALPRLKQFFLWVGQFSFSLYLCHILVLEGYLWVLNTGNIAPSAPILLLFLPLALLGGRVFEILSRWWVGLFSGGCISNCRRNV